MRGIDRDRRGNLGGGVSVYKCGQSPAIEEAVSNISLAIYRGVRGMIVIAAASAVL